MKLSVIMPCHNHEKFLENSIESVLNQSYKNFNFYIFNDNSQDKSKEIISKFSRLDNRIKVFESGVTVGATKALNHLIEASESAFIVRQDSDDFSSLNRFEIQAPLLEQYDLVATDHYIIDENNYVKQKVVKSNNNNIIKFNNLFFYYFGCHGNLMFRKNYSYNEKYCQDYGLVSKHINMDKQICVLNTPVYFYRKHSNTIYTKHRSKQILTSCKISQTNLKNIINSEISLKNILNLRHFFTYDEKFKHSKNFDFLLLHIKNIFLESYTDCKNEIEKEILNRINYFINNKGCVFAF